MAIYYGNDIGDAARAEERQLDRFLNLGLANRQFQAQQQSRADAIAQANAANAMQANRFDLQLDDAERTRRLNRALALEERGFDIEERDYGRLQHQKDVATELAEAEKQRQLQRELNEMRSTNYLNRLQAGEDQRTFADIAKRIATDDIRDLTSLGDVEGGRLGSEEWVDLKGRLGLRQQRLMEESAMGPEAAAREATLALQTDPSYNTAKDDASKRYAIDALFGRLNASRVFGGKIIPDYGAGTFKPVLNWKYGGPRDAIDWYGTGTTQRGETPPPVVTPEPERKFSFLDRIGLGYVGRNILRPSKDISLRQSLGTAIEGELPPTNVSLDHPALADAAAAEVPAQVAPPPPPETGDPLAEQKRREVRLLIRSGMNEDEAALRVFNKYRLGNDKPVYSIRAY